MLETLGKTISRLLGVDGTIIRIPWAKVLIIITPVAALVGGIGGAVVSRYELTGSISAPMTGASAPSNPRIGPSTTPSAAPSGAKEEASRAQTEPFAVSLAGKIAWPITLLLAVILLILSRSLRKLFGASSQLVKTIKAGGIEMELDPEKFEQVRDHLRSSFRELIADARDEYERMADLQDVDERLATVFSKSIVTKLRIGSVPSDLRATVHVRDVIIREFLYQLVDYVPKGSGAHRRFSQRYGIIGRTWRSGESHGTGNAFGGSASEEALVEQWGMTKREAHGMLNSKHSCLSILLRSGSAVSGVLYVDTNEKNAFGDDAQAKALATSLETDALVVELATAVERTMAPLRASAPNLDIKDFA